MSESGTVPKVAILDGFVDMVKENQGIGLAEAGAGRTLIVETQDSTYIITIQDPAERTVVVTGGKYFPESETCILLGSMLGGSFLRMGWIGLRMRMEFHGSNNQRITTTPVKKISLPGVSSNQVH